MRSHFENYFIVSSSQFACISATAQLFTTRLRRPARPSELPEHVNWPAQMSHRCVNKFGHFDFKTSVAIGDPDHLEEGRWTYNIVARGKLRTRYFPEWWATHARCEVNPVVAETFVHPSEKSVLVDQRVSRVINGTKVCFVHLEEAASAIRDARAKGLEVPPQQWLVTKNPTKKVRAVPRVWSLPYRRPARAHHSH